jgi:CO/xanthine dehydrogenase Mo-binding subunit
MSIRLDAGLDAHGRICSWQQEGFSYSHASRPHMVAEPGASGLLATWDLDPPVPRPAPAHSRGFHSGAHRNADPLYRVGARRIVSHLVDGALPRTSSLRALGAYANVFAIESFMDELAVAAGSDPVRFRLDHLEDTRARDVIEAVVEMAGGMQAPGGIDAPGRGLGFARYKNRKAAVAVIAEASVVARTGEIRLTRAWIAADAGEVIDPDGLVNQLEGGFVQAASWTLLEQVAFDPGGVTSRDWESYPILRFSEVPEIRTRLIDHPDEAPLGAGEAIAGPAAAAIANAVFHQTGARLRDLPLRPPRVKAALDALLDR